MGYRSVKQPKLSDVIMQRIEEMIMEGTLRPGQRLPPERELAIEFDVSRPSLREALQKLAAKGLLVSRQGGGTYVAETLGDGLVDPLLDLFRTHPEAQYDLLEFRHALEGVSAYYAALRSTDADRKVIRARLEDLERYHQQKAFDKEVSADVEFHLAIAASTHNVVLLHMMRALFTLLHQHIGDNLQNIYPKVDTRKRIHEQHHVLMEAICAGEAERARKAAHDHLVYVEEALLEQGKENTRVERALRRADLAG
ncbi:Lactate-responsive regulator LldR in Enterobacteria, GntR family [Marinobacterium lacunae]|uniref:Pyruvate dehydrogenase complex repressor n=1 Tax=Marinobacterium lacunae TaxID=1232683 RepID=A0A081G3R4_9GAMM|nr:pyruvate dehydrogenase complex transcriptional repressor PdhR [Marinobacterium lacunae]KEA65419.1 Lactate-responsive regulator LldR in Enterobacteria, GntR family [Marinobacterium lacunae]MBR9885006.1 pyruvate dehydrogenase complex transcriptional repressor PdhR [Oceanospirillales bacterium]